MQVKAEERSVGVEEMDHRKYCFKNAGHNFPDRARTRRSEAISKIRTDNRINILDSRRGIGEVNQVPAVKTVSHRAEMLAKWKAEKQRAMAELKKKQKPVFKVGILQRKATGSPILKMTTTYANKNFLKPNQINRVNKVVKKYPDGVITRAKSRALASQTNEVQKSSLSQVVNNQLKQIKNHPFTVPESVSAIALNLVPLQSKPGMKAKEKFKHPKDLGEENKENQLHVILEKNELIKTESTNDFVPIHYSPFVNKSRGSEIKSPRKSKVNLNLDVDKLIEKEENEFKCRLYSFRKYIECETKKLLDSCSLWRCLVKESSDVPEDVEEEILSLCGKTTLLTTDKFAQFKDLINKCENNDPMVKLEDLQGYQDWVSIEVQSLDQAFLKLEERRVNKWKTNENVSDMCQKKKEKKPVQTKKPVKPTGIRSKIRDHIEAVRKMKRNVGDISSYNQLETWAEGKTPVKTPRKQNSILKDVLNSEAGRINSSSWKSSTKMNESAKHFSGLEIVVATQMAKSLTPGKSSMKKILADQLSNANDIETPLKGILKQTPSSVNTSKHSVQFRLTRNSGFNMGRGLNERYFEPLVDEQDCCNLSIKMGDFTLQSPNTGRKKTITSTPIRRSARLATKF